MIGAAEPRRRNRERGATIPIVALVLPVLILATAFAIDLGRQRALRRDLQADADVISLDLAHHLVEVDDQTVAPSPATTLDLLNASLRRNGLDAVSSIDGTEGVTVEWGTWVPPRPGQECPRTIVTQPPSCFTNGTVPVNSVRVTLTDDIDYFFQPGGGSATRAAIATVGAQAMAGFSIGSFGANLDASNAGLLNSLLTPLLGNPADLDVLSYQGLAGASVGVADLGAELGLLSPDEVLSTKVGVDEAILAAATVLRRNGDFANADLLAGLITPEIEAMPPIAIGDVVHAEQGGETAALGSQVNVLEMIGAAAFASQCSDPEDLSTCAGLAIPSLTTTLPLVETTGSLSVIQGVQSVFGPVGSTARTSQVGADIGVVLGPQPAGSCTPSLVPLRTCVLSGLSGLLVNTVDAIVSVDASVRLADGFGTIDAIRCGTPLGLDVRTRTGLYEIDVHVTVEFRANGVLGVLLGTLLGTLEFSLSNVEEDVVDLASFDVPPDVLGVTTEETGRGDVGVSGLELKAVGDTSVLGILGSLGINIAGGVVGTFVNPVLTMLNQQVLGPLTDLLGVNVVGSDITPLRIECDDTGLKLVG